MWRCLECGASWYSSNYGGRKDASSPRCDDCGAVLLPPGGEAAEQDDGPPPPPPKPEREFDQGD